MISTDTSTIASVVHITQAGFDFSGTFSSVFMLILLLAAGAFVSGAEAAFFSLSPLEKGELSVDTSKTGKVANKLLAIPQQLLATILIINNFVNVAIVIVSSSLLTSVLGDVNPTNETVRFIIEVFVITLVLLLIVEVVPKIYATKNALSFAKFTAIPLNVLNEMPPFSWLKMGLVNGSNLIYKYTKKKGVKISSDELEHALALTKEDNASEEEHKILEGIVRFGNTDVRQIMCSRMQVTAIQDDLNYKEVLELILESGYSRIPVFSETFDDIKGILFIKDLLPFLEEDEFFNWKKLIRKPFFVPENKKIDDLLKEFQSKKVHMAIVVDEYGGASGIVTLEDVLEEIVGDITDEFDDAEILHKRVDENTFLIEGKISLNDFYKIIDVDGKDFDNIKGESDSLGGLIVENAGRILKNNEFLQCGNVKLIVESSDKKKIKMVKVVISKVSTEN